MTLDQINHINPYLIKCAFSSKVQQPLPGTSWGKRVTTWYELELILQGSGYEITNGIRHDVKKGDIFFRVPGTVTEGFCPYDFYIIAFDFFYSPEKMPRYSQEDPFKEISTEGIIHPKEETDWAASFLHLPVVYNTSNFDTLEEIFEALYHEFALYKNESSPFILKTYLYRILCILKAECSEKKNWETPSRSIISNYEKVGAVKKYIRENVGQYFSLEELSNRADLSQSFLSRIFKKIEGISLFEYINQEKIRYAKELLLHTNLSVKEIAGACGFDSAGCYFSTTFRKHAGMPPKSFRDMHMLYRS